ncbi:MAG: DUF5696 domain-containing protein [Christensenellales bacterium]
MKKRSGWKVLLEAALLLAIVASIGMIGWSLYGPKGGEGSDYETTAALFEKEGRSYTLENDYLSLQLDGDTTWFSLTNKEDGHVWHAVPPDAAKDPLALAGNRNQLQSTFTLSYSTDNGVRMLYDNYEYAIKNRVYQVKADKDRIQIDYTLGRIQRVYAIPSVISLERMEGFLSQLEKPKARKVLDSYRKYDPAKLKQDQKAELLAQYPLLDKGSIYVIRDNVKEFLKEEFEALFKQAGYSHDDYLMDQKASERDAGTGSALFNLSLIYRLEGRDLVVEVPMDSIRYADEYPPIKLNILPNFGAGGTADQGYMLVPEGGGGLIRFNNGKIAQNGYYADMYGWDYATWRSAVVHETNARFPMFALASGGSAFLCMMEERAASSSLNADIAGRSNSYNTASASYTLLHADAFNVTDRTIETIYMYEKALPEGSIRQRYRFLPTDDYIQLAQAYRQYLLEQYPLLDAQPAEGLPLAIEIIGAIDKVQQRGGLPVSAPVRVTSFSQAADIVREVASWSRSRPYVRLNGWMNGGVRQQLLGRATLVPQLGSAEDFRRMAAAMRESGARLYLHGVTGFALDSGLLEGFLPLRDAARFTTREEVELFDYSNIWYGAMEARDSYWLLKPALALDMIKELARAAKDGGAAGVSYEDVGAILSADYDPQKTVTRDEVMRMQTQEQRRLLQEGLGSMIRGGNLYALEAADLVTDTDLEGVRYFVLDESVPFIQIALHGLVAYTGKPINLAGDWQQELLLSAQRGAGLFFVFMQEEPLVLHDTDYSRFYGASFDLWAGQARAIIEEYEEKLGGVFAQAIGGFSRLPGQVTLTTYQDGTCVAVNFSQEDQLVLGQILPPRSYAVISGEVKQ